MNVKISVIPTCESGLEGVRSKSFDTSAELNWLKQTFIELVMNS
jgi:hypothetical protein